MREIILSVIAGFCFATFILMLDFAMEKGQFLYGYFKFISKWNRKRSSSFKKAIFKICGGCMICLGLWASYPVHRLMKSSDYLTFLASSQFILINRYGS